MSTNRISDRRQKFGLGQLRFNWHQIVQKVQIYCFDLLGNLVIVRRRTACMNSQGPPALCFELLDKIYRHNEEE